MKFYVVAPDEEAAIYYLTRDAWWTFDINTAQNMISSLAKVVSSPITIFELQIKPVISPIQVNAADTIDIKSKLE